MDSPSILEVLSALKAKFIDMEKMPCETHIYDLMDIDTWKDFNLALSISRQL